MYYLDLQSKNKELCESCQWKVQTALLPPGSKNMCVHVGGKERRAGREHWTPGTIMITDLLVKLPLNSEDYNKITILLIISDLHQESVLSWLPWLLISVSFYIFTNGCCHTFQSRTPPCCESSVFLACLTAEWLLGFCFSTLMKLGYVHSKLSTWGCPQTRWSIL